MVFIAFILSIVTLLALIVKRRDTPANLYLLAAFVSIQYSTLILLALHTYLAYLTIQLTHTEILSKTVLIERLKYLRLQ